MKNSIEDKIEEKYTRYINCETDTLELTIDEAIYILENDEEKNYVSDLLQEVYKIILSDYKRVLKENEKLNSKIPNLEQGTEILMETNTILTNELNDSISKQKIKDKIRKNEEIIDISNDGDLIHELLQKNKVYEELLESEE